MALSVVCSSCCSPVLGMCCHFGLFLRRFPEVDFGEIPPPLLGSTNPDYISQRRGQWKAYLNRLMQVPEALASGCLDECLGTPRP